MAAIDDLPEAVIDKMVQRDKAFWVDRPGANAYALHDAYYDYEMLTEKFTPPHQDVFPRSYQYDLDCVKHRRRHACDALKEDDGKKPVNQSCQDCKKAGAKINKIAEVENDGSIRERWRYYPDLNKNLHPEDIRQLMDVYGRPFKHEACLWYYKKFPPQKFEGIIRKFSK